MRPPRSYFHSNSFQLVPNSVPERNPIFPFPFPYVSREWKSGMEIEPLLWGFPFQGWPAGERVVRANSTDPLVVPFRSVGPRFLLSGGVSRRRENPMSYQFRIRSSLRPRSR